MTNYSALHYSEVAKRAAEGNDVEAASIGLTHSAKEWVQSIGYTPENSSNKTTVLSGSSTNVQYPSAKCVYDFVTQKKITTLATSGTVSPSTNTHNYIAPTAAVTVSLPASPDSTIVNEIELQINQTSAVTFNFGSVLWGDEGTPDMSVGLWDIIFTWIQGANKWVGSYKKWVNS